MQTDPSQFHLANFTDTCSVWNVLSSPVLYEASLAAGCVFCCTECIVYECLHKPRKQIRPQDEELKRRLRVARAKGSFAATPVSIEDIQDPRVLAARNSLDRGELSALAFALRTGQALMTDDQKALRVVERIVEPGQVQTTPKLFGWLFYTGRLADGDKDDIIRQHEELRNRGLRSCLEKVFLWALDCRLKANAAPQASDSCDDGLDPVRARGPGK